MATAPQFTTTANKGTPQTLTSANTATDGTGTVALIFTAGSSGSLVPIVRAMHLGSNVATVLRIFRNNGSDPTVAGNNALIAEKTIAANTLSQTAESIPYDIHTNLVLANGERLYATIGTAVAAGLRVGPVNAGDF
ncbi:MAG: hypothetical protein ACOY9J_03480 [Pseudomonadota bacterium]